MTLPPAPARDVDAASRGRGGGCDACVFHVDADGRLLSLDDGAKSLLAVGDDPHGADIFWDLLPAARQPAFYGRFREGVRRGRLDEVFPFVFGFQPPLRVRVRMSDGKAAGQYRIAFDELQPLSSSRERHAALAVEATVDRRSRAEPIDSGVCEREPIHIPGAVQAHTALLALDPQTLVVRAASEDACARLGLEGRDPLGRALDALAPAPVVSALRQALGDGRMVSPRRPWRRRVVLGREERPFLLTAHVNDGRLLLEFEASPEGDAVYGEPSPLDAQEAMGRIRAAPTLADAAAACADEVRAMTGFQRVLVYRFDPDWNGEAVAESLADGYDSLLGLRFPASDIPAQARALYTKAPGRFVLDRDAPPSALLASPEMAGAAVDLTYAQSRALSPIHLEYQRNLGVNGSMSLSILTEGRLWGLVIGHHHQPHYVAPEARALAAMVADAFALRLHELATLKAWGEQQAALEVRNGLLRRLAGSEDFVAALTEPAAEGTLLNLMEADGAAVVSGERVAVVGAAPPPDILLALAEWLRAALPEGQGGFSTNDLSEHWAPAADYRGVMSGVMAVFVGAERSHLLVWMRREVAATVVWGGDPNKPVMADSGSATVLPRRSFERWVEERRGQAEPWAAWQASSAEAMASAIEGVVLRQGRKIAELSAKERELTRALEQREILAREIDHRVKNSLQIVASIMLMQARNVDDASARAAFQETYSRVMSVARVHDSLQHAQDAETVDLGETLRLLCGDIAQGLSERADRLQVDVERELMAPSRTAVAVALIATELITNAFKYAYAPGEPGPVELRLRPSGEGFRVSVCDQGRGLPPDWADRPRSQGGLGMKVIRSMLTQIGADMSVGANGGGGTCFTITA